MVHDIEPAQIVYGMPMWPCACGRRFYSHRGAMNHLTRGSWRVPFSGWLAGR